MYRFASTVTVLFSHHVQIRVRHLYKDTLVRVIALYRRNLDSAHVYFLTLLVQSLLLVLICDNKYSGYRCGRSIEDTYLHCYCGVYCESCCIVAMFTLRY